MQDMPCTMFSEFQELIGLHKFYFGLLMTSTSFYLGIVGATLAYVAKGDLPEQRVRLSLTIPMILSIAACVGYGGGYLNLQELATWVLSCKVALKLGWAPHTELAARLSLLFSVVAALVSIALIAILAKPNRFLGAHRGPSS